MNPVRGLHRFDGGAVMTEERSEAFHVVADMEDRPNAALDYAFLLNDRLNRAEGAERDEMAALGRVAGDLWDEPGRC